jgi:glycosyltransferase involved in cell wall biosynthesis
MPVYNGERYVADAIESVLEQTFDDFELVVIDDGSTDRTNAILGGYAREDPRIVIHKQANSGFVPALNRGCGLARAIYIARIDADDLAMRRRLEIQVRFLDAKPELGVVGSAVTLIDSDGNALWNESYPLDHPDIVAVLDRFCPFIHSTVMIRRPLLAAVGGYRPMFGDAADLDLWLRLSECTRLANLPDVLASYRLHDAQATARRLEQMALSALIARAARRVRRGTGVDPTEGASKISPELLRALRISRREIAAERVALGLWYAKTIRAAGDAALARRVWWTTLKVAPRAGARPVRRVLQYPLRPWLLQLRGASPRVGGPH